MFPLFSLLFPAFVTAIAPSGAYASGRLAKLAFKARDLSYRRKKRRTQRSCIRRL
jgi:hypothetical protein